RTRPRRGRPARVGSLMTRQGAWGTLALAVLVVGGCLGKTTDSTAPLDILTPGRWVELDPMPTARQEVAVAELHGQVFVIGGSETAGLCPAHEPDTRAAVSDPTSHAWEPAAPPPGPTHPAAAAVIDGRLFVVGGYGGGRVSSTPLRTVYEYDEARSSWATPAPL